MTFLASLVKHGLRTVNRINNSLIFPWVNFESNKLGIFRCGKWLSRYSNIDLPLIEHISSIYLYIIDIYISSWSAIICGDQFTYRHFNIFIFTYQFQIYIQFLIHQFQCKFNFKYMHCNIVESFCQILPNLFIELFCFRASRIIYMTLHV